MKKTLSVIERILKRMTHRELSPIELELSKQNHIKGYASYFWGTGKTIKYSMMNGEPLLKITEGKLNTTNFSNSQNKNVELYDGKTINYRYTKDGKLIERVIQARNDYDYLKMGFIVKKFDPPGSWRGQKVIGKDNDYVLYR